MVLSDEQLKKAQELLAKILYEVHQVCEKNNIQYFLNYGTLLGAIRHNGFIPWDDDIDICMTRENYDKFCVLAPNALGKEFVLQNEDTDNSYGLCYSKVILNDTLWIENNAKKTSRKYSGLFIDIFPLDLIPEDKETQNKQLMHYKIVNMLLLAKLNYSATAYNTNKRLLFYFFKFLSIFFPLKYLKKKRNNIILGYSKSNSNLLTTFSFYEQCITKVASIKELTKHIFEKREYYIPVEYDRILTDTYGDYMTPPPQNERINHNIVEFDFGPYTK